MAENHSDNNESSRSILSGASMKWMVVGAVAIAFMVMFQAQIGRLLDRVTDVEVSSSGLKIKTVDTLIGKAEVSVVPVSYSTPVQDGISGKTFTSNQHKFQISWPNDYDWTADVTSGPNFLLNAGLAGPNISVPLIIFYNEMVGHIRPNVNVVVEMSGNMSIQKYMDLTIKNLETAGWNVVLFNGR